MNETVKAALLAERASAKSEVDFTEAGLRANEKRVVASKGMLVVQRQRLADIELHLKDNGVDLAAVDAEPEKARPKQSALQAYAGTQGMANQANANYQNALGGVNTNLGQGYSSLARAFDEA